MTRTVSKSRLSGKVALITGGASGIGLATAFELSRNGAFSCIADISEKDGKLALEKAGELGLRLHYYKVDVTQEEEVINMLDAIQRDFGRIDILFNNAGISDWSSIEDISTESWNRVLAANLNGQFYCIKNSLKYLKQNKGSIINSSSTLGLFGSKDSLAYCVSKSAVIGLTKAAAVDLAKYGVRVNCIAPGSIDTKMLKDELSKFPDPVKGMEVYNSIYPLGRIGKPEEVGKLVLFLASDDSSFITGSTFVIDGGLSSQWAESLSDQIFSNGRN